MANLWNKWECKALELNETCIASAPPTLEQVNAEDFNLFFLTCDWRICLLYQFRTCNTYLHSLKSAPYGLKTLFPYTINYICNQNTVWHHLKHLYLTSGKY